MKYAKIDDWDAMMDSAIDRDDYRDEGRGVRCPSCLWSLFDGVRCQCPKCERCGQDVHDPVRMSQAEAMEAINQGKGIKP